MSSSCIITKKGLKTIKWNPEAKKDDVLPCPHPAIHINHCCELGKGVTVKDIMNVVANDKFLTMIVAMYSDVQDIQEFHKELKKPAKAQRDFQYAEIYRTGSILDGEMNSYVDWHGVRTNETCEHCGKDPDHGHFVGLDFTPLNEIANVKVVLNNRFIVREDYKDIVLDVKTSFILIEVLHAIYYDISFYGGPKKRDAQFKELMATVDKIKKEKTIPMEDIFDD